MDAQVFDIHIIGGGIIGLCAAVTLQSRGVKVAILEADKIARGATYGNAGHIATEQVFPIADVSILRHVPAMLLNPEGPLRIDWRYLPRLAPWAFQLLLNMRTEPFARSHQALLALNAQSLQAWQDFAKEWQLHSWVQIQGSVLTAETPNSLRMLTEHGQRYRGGSPFYIERGLKLKPFAIIVAIVTCLSYGVLVPGVQANTIADSFNTAFNIPPVVTGIILVVLLGIIIFGGVKRIANFAGKVVPVMAIGYILMMVIVLAFNAQNIPAMFALIFKSAFGMDAVFGGMVGTAISWGVRRAVFSNVAGAGEATFSSAAAEVSHPAKQGLVQSFSIYIDTVLVCTATALMILSTGMYNVVTPEGVTLVDNMPGIEAGTAFTQAAVSTVFNQYGSGFVAIAIFLFAFTCLVAYYYIAETTLVYLDNKLRYPILKHVLKLVFLIVCFTGSVQSIGMMWALGDIGFGSMCYLNFIAILLLSKVALKVLKDYDEQMKLGINPVFDPRKAGVDNADFWIEYSNEHGHKKSL